jgi:DNA-directed RNA polymerase alpha subunit
MAGIMTIGDLCEKVQSSTDLKKIRNCGITSIAEIMDHLFAYQYHLLKPERRGKYLADVAERNLGPRKD